MPLAGGSASRLLSALARDAATRDLVPARGGYRMMSSMSNMLLSSVGGRTRLAAHSRSSSRLFTTPSGKPTPKTGPTATAKSSAGMQNKTQSWLDKFLGPKPMPERWTMSWYREVALICTVFAITGTSTMVLVRPAVSKGLKLKGSFREGPWSFRICSLVVMTPIYATLLVCVGTVFGRHHYFRHFSVKMWSRFGIPPEMIDPSYHQTKKTFRKW